MGLKEQQVALARLYTDPGARDELRDDPAAFARSFSLSDDEVAAWRQDVLGPASDFARSLLHKRFQEARKSIPDVAAALGVNFGAWFNEFATAHPPTPERNPALDARAFLDWLREGRRFPRRGPEIDAIAFAHARITMEHSSRRWLLGRYRDPDGRACIVVWWRWHSRLHQLRLPARRR